MLFKPEFSITIVMYTVCTYKEDNMGNYTVPDEIRSLKPTGTIVKKIRDNYYVYSHSQHKDPESGKWKTDAGKLMGKIIPGVGYCPSVEESSKGKITCFDYGEYLLACSLSVEDYEKLKECFNPDEAMQIFSLSVIFCLETYIGLKAAEDCFQRCLISHDYPDLRFSYRRLSRLLELVGRQRKASMFQRLCNTDEVTSIAVDGHAIPADSEGNDLCSAGYKTRALKSEYMNLMVALDCATRMPVASRVFPGYMLDKKDFLDFMGDVGPIKGKVILVDMGFFSAENLDYISQGGAYYVIPVEKKYNDYKLASSPGKGLKRNTMTTSLPHHLAKEDGSHSSSTMQAGRRTQWSTVSDSQAVHESFTSETSAMTNRKTHSESSSSRRTMREMQRKFMSCTRADGRLRLSTTG